MRVGISEFRIAAAPAILVAYGLGSCLCIVLEDRGRSLGGMAHTLLPFLRPGGREGRAAKFVDSAIRLMIDQLVDRGAVRASLAARIVGGANMFHPAHTSAEEGIGARNVRAARETLQALEIPLVAEDVGGSYGRTVEFHLSTGLVRVRSIRGGGTIIEI